MHSELAAEFMFNQHVAQLNHASYGAPTKATWHRVEALRRRLELNSSSNLGAHLVPKLTAVAEVVRTFLRLPEGDLAFTLNTTEAHESVARSLLEARTTFTVALRDDEYESMRSTWADAAAHTANDVSLNVAGDEGATDRIEADAVVTSVVASSTARLAQPSDAAATWVHVVDASHAPGHVDLDRWASMPGETAIVGSLHKWLPSVRPAGFLWLSKEWTAPLRPATASLRHPDSSPLERLSWRGTWDPAPHLALPDAIEQWTTWKDEGLVGAAEALADVASDALAELGLREWNKPRTRAPRLRAFVIPDCAVDELKDVLAAAGINAWVGSHVGHTLMRLSFNVYNDAQDVERVVVALGDRKRGR